MPLSLFDFSRRKKGGGRKTIEVKDESLTVKYVLNTGPGTVLAQNCKF